MLFCYYYVSLGREALQRERRAANIYLSLYALAVSLYNIYIYVFMYILYIIYQVFYCPRLIIIIIILFLFLSILDCSTESVLALSPFERSTCHNRGELW